MTDSLERFLEDLRFEVPAGLTHRAKAAAAADGRLHRRDMHWQRQPWGLTLVAAVLAVAIVATLIFTGRSLHPKAPVPSNTIPKALVPTDPNLLMAFPDALGHAVTRTRQTTDYVRHSLASPDTSRQGRSISS